MKHFIIIIIIIILMFTFNDGMVEETAIIVCPVLSISSLNLNKL